ncbi:hypothetical protein [Stratiformator vulcanicus]|nr:hypothetical protein [Stratiformator vulcanicus]
MKSRAALVACIAMIGAIDSRAGAEDLDAVTVPYEFKAYAVTVSINIEPQLRPFIDDSRLLRDLNQSLLRTFGGHFRTNITIGAPSEIDESSKSAAGDDQEPSQSDSNEDSDKIYEVLVRSSHPFAEIAVEEIDAATGTRGGNIRRTVVQEAVGETIVELIAATFRPIFLIEEVNEDGFILLRQRAGTLMPPDPAAMPAGVGTFVRPFYRMTTRDGELREIREIPWTYLQLASPSRGIRSASPISALRRPIGPRRRGSVTAVAILVRPSHPETTFKIVESAPSEFVFAGREVNIAPIAEETATSGDKTAEPNVVVAPESERVLITSRRGEVIIPQTSKRRPVWATVRSGSATLAKVPIFPGGKQVAVLELPSDEVRLKFEADIAALSVELTDNVARRAALLTKARRAGRSDQFQQAEQYLNDAERLPDSAQFASRAETLEGLAVRAANKQNNRVAVARIRAMTRQVIGVIDKYLGEDAVRVVREEVSELKQTAIDVRQPQTRPPDTIRQIEP